MIPYIIEPQEDSKEYRKNWARLIQKIYEVDPLTCPKCQGTMKVVGFIEDKEVIQKILKHLGIWLVKKKPSPKANDPPDNIEPHLDYSDCQLPPPARHRSRSGEAGGSYDYLYVDERYLKGPSASFFKMEAGPMWIGLS